MASIEKYKTDSGAPRWVVRYDVYENGKRKQKRKTFKTSKDASAFRSKVETAINTGMYADARGLTVGEYLDLWLSTYTTHNKPNAIRGYQNNIEKHLKPRIGNVRLDGLTTTAIQNAYNDILRTEYSAAKYETKNGVRVLVKPAKTYSPKTLRNINAVLHLALERARKDGLIVRNPAEDLKLPKSKISKHEYVIPDQEQLERLLRELRDAECYPAIMACTLLSCRRGEALGLYWSDIDFKTNTISLKREWIVNNLTNTVEIDDLKTDNSVRTIILPIKLREILLDMREKRRRAAKEAGIHVVDSPFVFVNAQGKPFRPDSVSQAFRRAAKRVGLDGMRLHDLRHTGVTHMLMAGIDPKTVSGVVGHASVHFTLNQYAHVMSQAKQQAAEVMNSLVCVD